MPETKLSRFYIYLISILVSLTATCGVGYFHMSVILDIPYFKLVYLAGPSIIGLIFGLLAARVILLNNKLKWCSIRDPLTHAFNHGYYKQVLNEWSDKGSSFSLILFDIDDFKIINDEYGHQVGDQTLIRVCKLVSDANRLYDIFARHGGEEFILLTPRSDLSEAGDIALRLCNLIAEASMPSGKKLTCSFGVAHFNDNTDTPDSLFKRADKALYKSKKNGKNQVTLETSV